MFGGDGDVKKHFYPGKLTYRLIPEKIDGLEDQTSF